jgi:hypothetical protein
MGGEELHLMSRLQLLVESIQRLHRVLSEVE